MAAARGGFRAFQALSAGAVDAAAAPVSGRRRRPVLVMGGRAAGRPVAVKLVGVFPGNAAIGPRHAPRHRLPARRDDRPRAGADGRRGDHRAAHRRRLGAGRARVRARGRFGAGGGRLGRPGPRAPASCCRWSGRSRTCGSSPAIRRPPTRLGVPAGTVEGADVICLMHLGVGAGAVAPRRSRPARTSPRSASPRRAASSTRSSPPAARLVVETRQAFSPPPAGCGRARGPGPVARGRARRDPRRAARQAARRDEEIIVYKSIGHIAEDAAAAALVYENALERGLGHQIEL